MLFTNVPNKVAFSVFSNSSQALIVRCLVGEQPSLAFLASQNGNEWEATIDISDSYLANELQTTFQIEVISNGSIVVPVKMPIKLEQNLTAVNVRKPVEVEIEPAPAETEEPVSVPSIKTYFKKTEEPVVEPGKEKMADDVKIDKPRFNIIGQMAKTDQVNERVKEKLKQIETPVAPAAPVVTKLPSVDIKKYTVSSRLSVLKEMANKK